MVRQRLGDLDIAGEAVIGIRRAAPFGKAAPDLIHRDDVILIREEAREHVEIMRIARKAMPHQHGRRIGPAPFKSMNLESRAAQIKRARLRHGWKEIGTGPHAYPPQALLRLSRRSLSGSS